MSDHPSPMALEAHQSGAADPLVAGHLERCDACRSYVTTLEDQQRQLLERESGADFARRIRKLADTQPERRRWWWWWAGIAAAAAVTVAMLLVATPEGVAPGGPVGTGGPTEIRLKSAPSLALIVLRDGQQRRETQGPVMLRDGDRIRVEVTVPQNTTLSVGILLDDGTWVAILDNASLGAGTHAPTRTLAVDSAPMRGRVLAGPADAITAARGPGEVDGLVVLEIETDAH